MNKTYAGFDNDSHGITMLGRVVLDARVFGFIDESEDCAGWDMRRMQALMGKVETEWDKYGGLPSRLPPELRDRHELIYARAMQRARERGWNPELDDESAG